MRANRMTNEMMMDLFHGGGLGSFFVEVVSNRLGGEDINALRRKSEREGVVMRLSVIAIILTIIAVGIMIGMDLHHHIPETSGTILVLLCIISAFTFLYFWGHGVNKTLEEVMREAAEVVEILSKGSGIATKTIAQMHEDQFRQTAAKVTVAVHMRVRAEYGRPNFWWYQHAIDACSHTADLDRILFQIGINIGPDWIKALNVEMEKRQSA